MDCEAYRILMTGYLDQELSDAEMHLLKAHLSTCASCCADLKRMETMGTVLKRYTLLQEVPEVPSDFAQNISVLLQGTRKQEKISLGAKVRTKSREVVLGIVERWVSSLRIRPFAWMTSVSVLMILLVGSVFVDVLHTVYEKKPEQQVNISPQPVMPVAQKDKASVVRKSLQLPAVAPKLETQNEPSSPAPVAGAPTLAEQDERSTQTSGESEPIQYVKAAPEPVTRAVKRDDRAVEKEEQPSPVSESSHGRLGMNAAELAKSAEESFIQVVKSDRSSVEGYVYSHVIESAQEQFIDDAVFVGYVQNISFK